jgi:hypothetical protein
MSTSLIDGTVAEAEPGRRRGAVTVFKQLRFDLADGSSHALKKAVVRQELAELLVPGTQGRFYLFNAIDISGIHGVRLSDGRSTYAFPANNQRLFLILGIINLLWVVTMIVARGAVPMLGVGLMILAAVGWYLMGEGQAEARQQFDGDVGPSAPVAAAEA